MSNPNASRLAAISVHQDTPYPTFSKGISRRDAFSLTELLVVIGIVGILGSAAIGAYSGLGRASGVRGAIDLAASLALASRIEGTSEGYGSLLVIDNGTNPDHKLRRFSIFRYINTPVEGQIGTNAVLVGKPTLLPKGVYFLDDYSTGYERINSFPHFPGGSNTPVLVYKFDGCGHLDSPVESRLVFCNNIVDGSGHFLNPTNLIAGRRGFILRKNGRPTYFENAEQMQVR